MYQAIFEKQSVGGQTDQAQRRTYSLEAGGCEGLCVLDGYCLSSSEGKERVPGKRKGSL